jgi:large subunit ribosomal protein L17
MRHGDKVNNLGRTKAHREAMLKNMSNSLIQYKRISTTIAKAKSLRRHLEPIITKAKLNTTHSRRVVFSYLQNKEAIKELFDVIALKVANRPGGYLRIIRTGYRKGDNAEMSIIEFVDYNEVMLENKENAAAKSKRTRRGSKKNYADSAAQIAEAKKEQEKLAKETAEREAREAANAEAKAAKEAVEAEERAAQEAKIAAEQAENAAAAVVVDEVAVIETVTEVEAPSVVEEVALVAETPVVTEEVAPEVIAETETIFEKGTDEEFDSIADTDETTEA